MNQKPQDSNQSSASKKKSYEKVSPVQARIEFMDWITNVRRVKARYIEDKNPDTIECIDNCVANIVDGTFSIDSETNEIIHNLVFPVGEDGNNPITQLRYAPRMYADAFTKARKFKNPDENTKTLVALGNLSKQNFGIIDKMEESDVITATDLLYFYFLG